MTQTPSPMMLHAPSLSALRGVRHAFFTRHGGVSEGLYASLNGGVGSRDVAAHVAENRARMALAVGAAPENFLTAYQIHSPDVIVVDEGWRGLWGASERPRGDALVTRMPGIALGVSSADCGPILFADAEAGVIGGAHAGWRGALSGVLEATLDAMENLGARRGRILAALGPMIGQPNYEVGADMIEQFVRQDAGYSVFFGPGRRAGHAQFDLPGFIAARLRKAGLSRIEDLGACTYADPGRFFSFRRSTHRGEADYGRHINAIALTR